MNALIEFLTNLAPGPISDTSGLQEVLFNCWESIEGSGAGGMKAYKLSSRIEKPKWEPPLLTFEIERHGGTVLGSSRADIQRWTINTSLMEADVSESGYRQLTPNSPAWTVKQAEAAAEGVANAVRNRQGHDWITHLKNGGLKINIALIVPSNAATQTITGRRKKFWKILDEKLSPDWSRTGVIYKKAGRSSEP